MSYPPRRWDAWPGLQEAIAVMLEKGRSMVMNQLGEVELH